MLEDINRQEITMYFPHAYSIVNVEEANDKNIVTLVNPHNTSISYKFDTVTLLNVDGFRLYEADWD